MPDHQPDSRSPNFVSDVDEQEVAVDEELA
jgi:hypothetical protein